jgi:hypothetical protein
MENIKNNIVMHILKITDPVFNKVILNDKKAFNNVQKKGIKKTKFTSDIGNL